ncbi:Clavaminate synthase-like protein [Irpex lacteus]|nr:Clavaminate synthase-like protein [Irpex lacteus]
MTDSRGQTLLQMPSTPPPESTATMPGTIFPAFPNSVPTHPLLVIDYELIKAKDEQEIRRLWDAATMLGFWYLKNHGTSDEAERMFEIGASTMEIPLEEKMKYEQGDNGSGANVIDSAGNLDCTEFLNISKNDALAWPAKVHREYPATVDVRMESTVKPFIVKSEKIIACILDIFNDKLGLTRIDKSSGCHSRCISAVSHTDFGSLSILHNKTGGLQVLTPGSNEYQYIKPLPGYVICNIGDALSIFSGGILHSNLHRVVTPPGDQAGYERWSLVYFSRPYDSVVLNALDKESTLIADVVARSADSTRWYTGQTAKDWVARRIKNRRVRNFTGPEAWKASHGTEYSESRSAEVRAY